jgi:protein AFG1
METIDDDYAAEAGYSRPQFLRQPPANEERNPPVIKEHHVWGVVDEWGDNVGRWGKGAKAFDGDGSNGRDRKKEE